MATHQEENGQKVIDELTQRKTSSQISTDQTTFLELTQSALELNSKVLQFFDKKNGVGGNPNPVLASTNIDLEIRKIEMEYGLRTLKAKLVFSFSLILGVLGLLIAFHAESLIIQIIPSLAACFGFLMAGLEIGRWTMKEKR